MSTEGGLQTAQSYAKWLRSLATLAISGLQRAELGHVAGYIEEQARLIVSLRESNRILADAAVAKEPAPPKKPAPASMQSVAPVGIWRRTEDWAPVWETTAPGEISLKGSRFRITGRLEHTPDVDDKRTKLTCIMTVWFGDGLISEGCNIKLDDLKTFVEREQREYIELGLA